MCLACPTHSVKPIESMKRIGSGMPVCLCLRVYNAPTIWSQNLQLRRRAILQGQRCKHGLHEKLQPASAQSTFPSQGSKHLHCPPHCRIVLIHSCVCVSQDLMCKLAQSKHTCLIYISALPITHPASGLHLQRLLTVPVLQWC